MSYSQAIEQQAAMLRFVEGGFAFGDTYLSTKLPEGTSEDEMMAAFQAAAVSTLRIAEPFYWDVTTCELIQQTAPAMPDMTLRPEDLIVPAGFAWFATPLALTPYPEVARDLPMLGFAWRLAPNDGVLLLPLTPHPGRSSGAPAQVVMWRFEDGFAHLLENVREMADLDAVKFEVAERLRGIGAHRRVEQMRYVAACLVFMNQHILVTTAERAPRATRKRLAQDGWIHEPVIRVVQLRRAATTHQMRERNDEPVEWSCSWVVRGHWRQQWFPKRQVHRPVWIAPHIKGPEGAPLIGGEKVYALKR